MKATELRQKDDKELTQELESLQRALFNLRMKQGSGQMSDYHKFKITRKDIARINTILTERRAAQ